MSTDTTNSSATAPSKDTIVMEATMTTESGVVVPINVTIEYPTDYGMFAIHLMKRIPEYSDGIVQKLIDKNDASVLAAVMES